MRLYLGNKMVGLPEFNFPWFDATAKQLRAIPEIYEVFNPAERDRAGGFDPKEMEGRMAEMTQVNFSRREALAADTEWICKYSDGMVAGPDWVDSPGTMAEVALHHGLHLPVWLAEDFLEDGCSAREIPPMIPALVI